MTLQAVSSQQHKPLTSGVPQAEWEHPFQQVQSHKENRTQGSAHSNVWGQVGGKAAKPKPYAYPEAVSPTQTQIHPHNLTAFPLGASSTQSQRAGTFIPSFGSGETQGNRTRGDGKKVGNLLHSPALRLDLQNHEEKPPNSRKPVASRCNE